jgi:hypothetical protein
MNDWNAETLQQFANTDAVSIHKIAPQPSGRRYLVFVRSGSRPV